MEGLPETLTNYNVLLKLAFLTYEQHMLQGLILHWQQACGCQVEEDAKSIRLIMGKRHQTQFSLTGRKGKKYVYFESGKILDPNLTEIELIELLARMSRIQRDGNHILGLVVSKNGQSTRPLVIRNGEVYDEGKMMDMLWNHFVSTRLRESRRMEEVYYFLRDVAKT